MSECLGKIKHGMEKREAEKVCFLSFFNSLIFFLNFFRNCSAFCLVCVCVYMCKGKRREEKLTREKILRERAEWRSYKAALC